MTDTRVGLRVEQALDLRLAAARLAATDRTAAALRELTLDRLLNDRQLRLLAAVAADAALAMPPEQADLFGTRGRLVARQWDTIDALRGDLEHARLDQAVSRRTGGRP